MNCEVCDEKFLDSMNGLVEMTFHKIIQHGSKLNKKYDDEDIYLNMLGGSIAK